MTKFQVGTILTCHTMDGQVHSIGKAIRSPIRRSGQINFDVFYGNAVKCRVIVLYRIDFHNRVTY